MKADNKSKAIVRGVGALARVAYAFLVEIMRHIRKKGHIYLDFDELRKLFRNEEVFQEN